MDIKKTSMREALGRSLVRLGETDEKVVVVGADTTDSIKLMEFGRRFPSRFFNVGIAEQNMIGISAGLALSGKKVFCGTYVVFLERAIDQIRNTIAYCSLDVKIIGSHGGISVGPDGGSHQAIEDFAIMRTIPNMKVIAPSDSESADMLIEKAGREKGPFYIRILRPNLPQFYDSGSRVEIGKANLLREGSDVTIIANGVMLGEAMDAAGLLEKEGIFAEVIDCHTIKPLDLALIEKSARKTGAVVTAEDHNIIGGLGSAVAEALSEAYPVKMRKVGVRDVFGQSGDGRELMSAYGLDSANIIRNVREIVNK